VSGATAFELLCYFGAVAGVIAYVVNYGRQRTAARLLNSSGLFLTAMALAVLPHALRVRAPEAEIAHGWLVLGFLLLALLAQAAAALRVRPSREGRQDRAADRAGAPT
jgi:hypothetical protein